MTTPAPIRLSRHSRTSMSESRSRPSTTIPNTSGPSAKTTPSRCSQRATAAQALPLLSAVVVAPAGATPPEGAPTLNWNDPPTGCVSAEMARQRTSYVPEAVARTVTWSWVASSGATRASPPSTRDPSGPVTTTASGGAWTGSESQMRTMPGAEPTTEPGAGSARTSTACARVPGTTARQRSSPSSTAPSARPARCRLSLR